MKNNHDDFDGFTVNLFFDEDGDYFAHFVETALMCLRFRSNYYRRVGGIKGTRSRLELMLKNVIKNIMNLSRKHLHGMDTRDRSIFPLKNNFITLWQTKRRKRV